MTQPLNYACPGIPRRARVLAVLAFVALLSPLFIAGALYGEWLLHKVVDLGSRPNWMDRITTIALIGAIPMAIVSALLNGLYVAVTQPSRPRVFARWIVLAVSWAA